MDLPPFALERWLDTHETDAEILLAESGIRPLSTDEFDLAVGELGYVIPTDGDPAFRAEIAERYDRTAHEIVLTCGTQEANFLAINARLDPADHAVVVEPTYQSLASLPAAMAEATTVHAEPPDWAIPLETVADAMRANTALIVLANPANPTGRYHDRETIAALAELAATHDATLLVDEVYRQLAPDPDPPAATLGPHAISTAGVSKAYGLAGARIGWVVAEPILADRIRTWKDYTTISPPIVGQAIARQALGEMEADILARNCELAATNRERVAAFLADHDLAWHEPTGVLGFPTVPEAFDDGTHFCRSLFDAEGVLLAPGECFGQPDRFRIGFGVPTPTLAEGLERMARHIDRQC